MSPELQQIYWYSGLYLQPQHFQSLELHFNYMLAQQRQLAQPSNYGIIHYKLDIDALQGQIVKFDQLRLILPSGYYLEYPGNCQIAPRSIHTLSRRRDKPLTLWLALRRFNPHAVNVAGSDCGAESTTCRWMSLDEGEPMPDLYHTGTEAVVQRIAFNAFLIGEEERESVVDCELLPVLQLDCTQDHIDIAQNYIPPSMTIDGSPVLKKMLEGLCAELIYHSHQLSTAKPAGDRMAWSSHPDYLMQFLAMCSLNRALPLFNHYCSAPALHPWYFYGLLAQLIGELASLADEENTSEAYQQNPQPIEPYDHYQLFTCFNKLKITLLNLLNALAKSNAICLTLEPNAEQIYSLDLAPVQSLLSTPVFLVLHSETLTKQRISTLAMDGFKISSKPTMQALIEFSLPGVGVNLQIPPPRQLALPQDTFCLLINQSGELWNDITQQLNLSFYWASAPDDLKVQLVLMGQSI